MRGWVKCVGVLVLCGLVIPASAQDVQELVRQLRLPDAEQRRAAAKSLVDLGPEAKSATSSLVNALRQDKDLFVRRFAAQALGDIEADPKLAVPALAAVLKDDHKELVEAAVVSLGKMGEPAVQPLLDVVKNKPVVKREKGTKKGPMPTDPSAFVRGKAVEALGNLGPKAKPAVPTLIESLKDPREAGLRTDVVVALGKIGPAAKDALPALQEAAQAKGAKKDKAFKSAVGQAIKKIQGKA